MVQQAPSTPGDPSSDAVAAAVVKALEDDKAQDVAVLDVREHTSWTDMMIIATGQSSRHVTAMAKHLLDTLAPLRGKPVTEGQGQGDWVLLDAGDVVVHLFRPEVRGFYDLEGMWRNPPVDRSGDTD